MKERYTFIILFILLLSCNKKEDKRYSKWTFNTIEHNSNNANYYIGNGQSFVTCEDHSDRWSITFYSMQALPQSGDWSILSFRPNGNNPNYVYVQFYEDSTLYAISPYNTNLLHAQEVDGKSSYTLQPTWFIKMENHDPGNYAPADSSFTYTNDSVLISGIFNQP